MRLVIRDTDGSILDAFPATPEGRDEAIQGAKELEEILGRPLRIEEEQD